MIHWTLFFRTQSNKLSLIIITIWTYVDVIYLCALLVVWRWTITKKSKHQWWKKCVDDGWQKIFHPNLTIIRSKNISKWFMNKINKKNKTNQFSKKWDERCRRKEMFWLFRYSQCGINRAFALIASVAFPRTNKLVSHMFMYHRNKLPYKRIIAIFEINFFSCNFSCLSYFRFCLSIRTESSFSIK